MDWIDGVAMRLVLLSRNAEGKLTHDRFVGATVRAALLVDLALDRRISDGD